MPETYTRYFQVLSPSLSERAVPAATSISARFLGRERGGLCDEAVAEIPGRFPEDYGIRKGDLVVIGYNSEAANHWYHGIVANVEKGGVYASSFAVTALGIEHVLKNIYPRTNYGQDPGNPYGQYANPSITNVADIVQSLFNTYISSDGSYTVPYVTNLSSIDATTETVTFLDYDGTTSLYDILNSLCELTGYSWGFNPATVTYNAHQFFFEARSAVYNPNFSKFVYGTSCTSLAISDPVERVINDVTVTGARVPKISRQFTRKFRVPASQSIVGPRARAKRIPGARRTNDLKLFAAKTLARRADPAVSLSCTFRVTPRYQTAAGPILRPNYHEIHVVSAYDSPYNPAAESQYAYEINALFDAHSIILDLTLGETEDTLGEQFSSKSEGVVAPQAKQAFDYDLDTEEFTEIVEFKNALDRVEVISLPGIIETTPTGAGNTANVRVAPDSSGGTEVDLYRELLTSIPVPSGLGIGDEVDLNHWFKDDELQEITASLPGESETGSGEGGTSITEINYALASGQIALYNTTIIKDLGDYTPTGAEDANIAPGGGTAPEARLGDLIRVKEANKVALNGGVGFVLAATGSAPAYNTAHPALGWPSSWTSALLRGNVIGVTSNGEVCLGDISGSYTVVNVKTAAAAKYPMRLLAAVDPLGNTYAAPYGAITVANT